MPIKWAQVTVFKASAKRFRDGSETPPLSAIRVRTLGRIERRWALRTAWT